MSLPQTPEGEAADAQRGVEAFIGVGSNLANPGLQIDRALAAIARIAQTRIVARSRLYRTAPQGVSARQPDYLNAVARVITLLRPEALLRALQQIERAQRRRRSAPNAARTIDLDLLLYGALRRRSRKLAVPHPRLHRRAFVLKPLLELSPDIAVPGVGRARKHLQRTRGQRVMRLGP